MVQFVAKAPGTLCGEFLYGLVDFLQFCLQQGAANISSKPHLLQILVCQNWRGDVVALYDSTGALFARYDYNAWGKLLSIYITTVLLAAVVTAVFIVRKRNIK